MGEVSEARLRANRLNALRSTGPRTAEGKDAARRNAVRHGLTSEGTALPDDLAGQVETRLAAWRADWRPSGEAEETLLRELVTTSVQLDAAHRREWAQASSDRLRAEVAWDDDRQVEVEDLAARLAAQPARVAARLRSTLRGCLWLAARWDALARAAGSETEPETASPCPDADRSLAFDLLGVAPELRPGHPLTDRLDAPAERAAFAREQSAALLARTDAGLTELDAVERDQAASGLALDPTPAARQLRRYRQALAGRFDRLFALWTRLRRERLDGAHEPADSPQLDYSIGEREPTLDRPMPVRPASAVPVTPGGNEPNAAAPLSPNRRARRAALARLRRMAVGVA